MHLLFVFICLITLIIKMGKNKIAITIIVKGVVEDVLFDVFFEYEEDVESWLVFVSKL